MPQSEVLRLIEGAVKEEWVDEFGHMNMARYLEACDLATYAFWEMVNGGTPLEQRGGAEYAVVESHVNYLDELRQAERFFITTQLLGADAKRFRLFHSLYKADGGTLVATNEIMALGFDLEGRGIMNFAPAVARQLDEVLARHEELPMPKNAGRAIAEVKRS